MQFTASFKERGALNRLLCLTDEERRRGVVATSAGNHGQGVAYHAKRLRIPATIVMPCSSPFTNVARTRDLGANVRLEGDGLAEAAQSALALSRDQNLTFVHPFDDPFVIAGQGTLALEMLEDVPELDVLVVPIGGGGLISGIAIAAKGIKPSIEIVGVQCAAFPSIVEAIGRVAAPVPGGLTVAEGIAVKAPGKLTRAIVRDFVDDIMVVEE
ncbi:MAG: pyridoxal-phosphate dependent enzyme, partial [Sphingomonadaceae bacterium]